jgi:hypothetical protein
MNPAHITAISILCGSAMGAVASLVTTWLTHRHQNENRRRAGENARLERIFEEFIDSASKAFGDALLQTSMEDPSKVVPLYATMKKLRLFASQRAVEAADKVMSRVVETYYAPKFDLQTKPAANDDIDILREFVEMCRAELRRCQQ